MAEPSGGVILIPGARPHPDFQLVERIGQGSCGEVWKALGPGNGALALKFIRLGEGLGTREDELLEILKHVRHPNLLPIFGSWQTEGYLILGMELAETSLPERSKQFADQRIPCPELLKQMGEAAEGIDYLNEQRHPTPTGEPISIPHQNIKPENLLLLAGKIKVSDFGLAMLLPRTAVFASFATPLAFVAPELLDFRSGNSSDQYSLAVTYCKLRTGTLPFAGTTRQILNAKMSGEADLTLLPEGERPVVRRALAQNPEGRWASCREMVEQLRKVARPTGFWKRLHFRNRGMKR